MKTLFLSLVPLLILVLVGLVKGDVRSNKISMTHHLRCRVPSVNKPLDEIYLNNNVTDNFLLLANKMRKEKLLTDVTISSDGVEFAAHKLVLASGSDYFLAMFNGPLACQSNTISLFGIPANAMKYILDYIYTGKIIISNDNVFEVLNAASLLLLSNLKNRCEKYLTDRLDYDNALQIFSYAKQFSLNKLVEFALDFIALVFSEISQTDEFKQLDIDDLNDIITLENLSIDSEDSILDATLSWLEHNVKERATNYSKVLRCIRTPFVSNKYLESVIAFNEVVQNDSNLMLLFERLLNGLFNDDNRCITPRKCTQFIPSIISMGGTNLNIYNEELDQWCEITKCKARHCPGMDVIGCDIYVVGGSLEWKRKATGEKFNTETNVWTPIADMSITRSNFGLVQRKGRLYAIGGFDGDSPLRSCEMYDPLVNKWSSVSPLHRARDGACCLSDGEDVYAIGGYDGTVYCTTVERYNEDDDAWDIKAIPCMSEKRQNAMSAYWDGRIYVVGGYHSSTHLSSIEMLDLELNEWSTLSPMPIPRHHAGASAMNGCVYVCGGWSGQLPVQHVDIYTIKTDTWSRVASLPTPTMIRCAAVNFPKKSLLKLFKPEQKRNASAIPIRSNSFYSQSSDDSYFSNSSC